MLGEAIFPRGPREGLRFAVCVVRLSRDAGWVICVLKEPAEPVQNVPPSQAGTPWLLPWSAVTASIVFLDTPNTFGSLLQSPEWGISGHWLVIGG